MHNTINLSITSANRFSIPLTVLAMRVENSFRAQNKSCDTISSFQEKIGMILKFKKFISSISFEVQKAFSHPSSLSSLPSPRMLQVPQLPEPPFYTFPPPRFFWNKSASFKHRDEYAPCGLLKELREGKETDPDNCAGLMQVAQNLFSLKGILRQDSQGFLYLDVSDDFVYKILPLLKETGIERPPYFEYTGPFGAHFAIILSKELRSHSSWKKIPELGQEFSFELIGCHCLEPAGWAEMEKVWFFTIKCPQAERLREKHLLPSLINNHEFHITCAVKRRSLSTPQKNPLNREIFRLNISCFAA
jgi:hypothetical protein